MIEAGPHFPEQFLLKTGSFLENLLGLLLQLGPVRLGQIHRGDDHHGNLAPVLLLVQFGQHLETVHDRHHQIQKDHRRNPHPDFFHRRHAVLGVVHGPFLRLQPPPEQIAKRPVVLHDRHAAG